MKRSTIFVLIVAIIGIAIHTKIIAQDSTLYIPRNVQRAYNDGTRSFNGEPGPNYWQNYADYNIKVEIDTTTRSIIGDESIVYKNNSPDTLKQICFRLYQNLYKKGTFRDFPVDTIDLTDGMKIKELTINGNNIALDSQGVKYRIFGTNMFVKLDSPMLPKQNLKVGCKWSFIMPLKTDIRIGMIDSTSYYVGYWYPQISVYDDIDGWDISQYTGQQEFYNNFSNFNVEITVPKNYVVWATGILNNPADVLTEKYLERRKEAETSDSVIHIITLDDLKNGDITSDNLKNTWHFKAENVTDFAFAASDHYLWDEGSIVVDDKTNRRTVVAAAFGKKAMDFPQVAKIGMESIQYYSKQIPGIPFPYPKITVVNGAHSGGMEFPMMVNDYSAPNINRTIGVTAHEIAHTYFPFYMGIDETKYAWMDEGWATALTACFESGSKIESDSEDWITKIYEEFSGYDLEMPMMIPSVLLKFKSYSAASYFRPAEAYLTLRELLGDNLFLKALHEYINRWHGKHPMPYDFFYTFNNSLNENLNWFWKPWFFEPGAPDLAIKKVNVERNEINVLVEKVGNIPIPIQIKAFYSDSTTDSLYYNAAVWKDGNKEFTIKLKTDKRLTQIILGNNHIPDVDIKNNVYIFK